MDGHYKDWDIIGKGSNISEILQITGEPEKMLVSPKCPLKCKHPAVSHIGKITDHTDLDLKI